MKIAITALEVWKPVVGYEGRYEVSSLGRVRSLGSRYWHAPNKGWKQKRSRILTHVIHQTGGYPVVTLYSGGKQRMHRVHVLVLTAFRGPCPKGCLSRHLDGNPPNVRLSNLQWGTPKENGADRIKHGRGRGELRRGEDNPRATLTWAKVKAIREARAQGARMCELAKEHKVSGSAIYSIVHHRTWKETAA